MKLLALVLFCASLSAQELVKDINTQPSAKNPGSSPQELVVSGARVWFAASDGRSGVELWCSDGTAAGTHLAADIAPGPVSSNPFGLVDMNGEIFCFADDGAGVGLWRSQGTRLVTRVPYSREERPPIAIKDRVFFFATDSKHGTELWTSDGTAGGTRMTGELVTGAAKIADGQLMSFLGECWLLFDGNLCKSDGTPDGTQIVRAMARPPYMNGRSWAVMGGKLYFPGYELATGRELWSTDGTTSGTRLVRDISSSTVSDVSGITALAGRILFQNEGLWSTDGTSAGTALLASGAGVGDLALVVAKQAFFAGNFGSTGAELVATDGTPQGTRLVANIHVGPTSSRPSGFCALGDTLYFHASDEKTGRELWRSDGTTAGTWRVREIQPGLASAMDETDRVVALGARLLFRASEPGAGAELWSSDGSEGGTRLVADISPALVTGSAPRSLTVVGDRLFFVADDGVSGEELWTSDGTHAGTRMVQDLYAGALGSSPWDIVSWRDSLVFVALDTRAVRSLWITDGTAAGTRMILDGALPDAPRGPGYLHVVRDRLLFVAGDLLGPKSLWSSDGTASGTVAVRVIASSGAGVVVAASSQRLFAIGGAYLRSELWVSDGTATGTTLVKQFAPHELVWAPRMLGDDLYFLSYPLGPMELWRSDGTLAGTKLVAGPTTGIGWVSALLAAPDRIWFHAEGTTPGTQSLCFTRGDQMSTRRVRDFAALPFDRIAFGAALAPGTIVFPADDGVHGMELWCSDGTSAGTGLVKDILPGRASAFRVWEQNELQMVSVARNPRVLFSALNESGYELFATDGTSGRTVRMGDVLPGPGSSFPRDFTRVGDTVFFSADDGVHGRELWKLSLRQLGGALADPLGGGCSLSNALVPRIEASGIPVLGNLGFAVSLTSASPNAPLVWLANVSRRDVTVGPCTLRVAAPAFIWPDRTNALGNATLPLPIPGHPALLGLDLYLQAAPAEPGGTFVLSHALRLLIGS